jgi:hypothetical protein
MRRKSDILPSSQWGAVSVDALPESIRVTPVQLAHMGTILSLFAYSRELEPRPYAMGLKLMAEANYDPTRCQRHWQQLIEEVELSAKMRKKRPNRGYSLFATPPAPKERMVDLRVSAKEVQGGAGEAARGRERYLKAIGPHRLRLLDDQVKLNDPAPASTSSRTSPRTAERTAAPLRSGDLAAARREGRRCARGLRAMRSDQYADAPPGSVAQPWLCLAEDRQRDEGKARSAAIWRSRRRQRRGDGSLRAGDMRRGHMGFGRISRLWRRWRCLDAREGLCE